jgi:hypothetical protein
MELEDRRDNLRLLALVGQALGIKELEEYRPPSEEIAEDLANAGVDESDDDDDRSMEVLKFIAETGGG